MSEPEHGWRGLGLEAFRAIFEHAMDGLLFTVPDGRILAANPAACALLGRTEEEICALGRQGLADTSDPRWQDAVAARAQSGQMRAQLRMRRADGSIFQADVASAIFTTPTGEVRACVIFRDLSAEIAQSKELALLEQRDRIASEVHALVLTRVSAALVELDGLIGRVQEELVLERLTHARAMLEDTLVGVRQTVASSHTVD